MKLLFITLLLINLGIANGSDSSDSAVTHDLDTSTDSGSYDYETEDIDVDTMIDGDDLVYKEGPNGEVQYIEDNELSDFGLTE